MGVDVKLLRITGLALVATLGQAAASAHATQASPQTTASSASTPTAPPADDQAASELKDHHRHHHHGGVVQFVAMSLDTLGADDAKRPQIEKLQGDLHAQMAPAREAEKNLLQTLADGVAAGAIDKGKVEANITKVTTAADAVHAASRETLNRLHAILSPAERAALVDKVQAHWEVWHQVNHEEELAGREHAGRLAGLAQELTLTPNQADKISAALHTAIASRPTQFDPKQGEAHVQAFSTAFAGDTFDAKSITSNTGAHIAGHGAARMALFYETVAPLLTSDQRTKLAEHLREHASYPLATSAK